MTSKPKIRSDKDQFRQERPERLRFFLTQGERHLDSELDRFNNIDSKFRGEQMRANRTRVRNLTAGRQMLAAAEFSRLQPQLNDLMGLKNRRDQVQRQIDMLIGVPFDPWPKD